MIDMHVHTNFSDGKKKPIEVVELFRRAGYEKITITDHETIDGFLDLKENSETNTLEVLPGIELEWLFQNKKIHALAYDFYIDNKEILDFVDTIKKNRRKEAVELFRKLRDFDKKIYFAILQCKDVSFQRIIDELVNRGYGNLKEDILRKYFSEGKDLYVKEYFPNMIDTAALVKRAGGFVSLAHPKRYFTISELASVIDDLRACGIEAIECFHPSHDENYIRACLNLAHKYHMKITVGSDYHDGEMIYSFSNRIIELEKKYLLY